MAAQYPPPQGGGGAYPPPQGGGGAYPPPAGGGYPPPGGSQQRWQPQGQGGQPYQWENTPTDPVLDNPNAAAPAAPQMQNMQQFQGYNNAAGFGQPFAPVAPPPPPQAPSGQAPEMKFDRVGDLTEEECREAMVNFVSEHCCYGSKPAKLHDIKAIQSSTALHYTLETFCEGRNTGNKFEPFRGQPIDGPENGMPPPPWIIPCQADSMFHNHIKNIEVPHTANVKNCHHCDGRGFNRCYRCHGGGRVRCGDCGGDGRTTYYDHESQSHRPTTCGSCHGSGRRSCYTCGGDGRITCDTCDGYCRLKCYIELSVIFANHEEDHILEQTDMPDELVRNVKGDLLFEQTLPQIWPIQHYPVAEIAQNSVRIVQKHRSQFPNERQLQQRQKLRGIPVSEVSCKWDDWESRYWVYGQERKVHCPDYPQTCCWGCNII